MRALIVFLKRFSGAKSTTLPGFLLLIALVVLLAPKCARAQSPAAASAEIAGRLEGNDISVENGPPAGASSGTPGLPIANGTIVTVHSGDARLALMAGGEVDICGPAKLTFLDMNGAITIALDFGRVRTQLPNELPLKIYTPVVVATPMAISGGARDATLGLAFDNELCVQANQGALRIEEQFTGQDLIVPQAGDFLISGGTLSPIPGPPGSCQCDLQQAAARPPAVPSTGLAAAPKISSAPASNDAQSRRAASRSSSSSNGSPIPDVPLQASISPSSQPHLPAPLQPANASIEFSVPASHPTPPPEKKTQPTAPEADVPVWTAVMPPLTFSASSPEPPPIPSPQTILLVREARVEPEWVFNGHVDTTKKGSASSKPTAASSSGSDSPKSENRFWTTLKKIFLIHS